ncbi:reverse transcriptase domain-containing protein [Tanacetum coccineum]
MTDKYCPQGEIKKLEIELWNLKVKGNDVPTYTERFQELTLICTKFVANETEKVDKYISGLSDNIYGNVKSARPKMLDETIELANDLMDQKHRTYAEKQSGQQKKLMIHPETTMVTRNNPSKGKMSPRSTIWGQLQGNVVLSVEHQAFQRDCPKLKNKDEGNGNAQGWVLCTWNSRKKENASETRMPSVARYNGRVISFDSYLKFKSSNYMQKDARIFLRVDQWNSNHLIPGAAPVA